MKIARWVLRVLAVVNLVCLLLYDWPLQGAAGLLVYGSFFLELALIITLIILRQKAKKENQ